MWKTEYYGSLISRFSYKYHILSEPIIQSSDLGTGLNQVYINWPYAKVPDPLGLSLWLKKAKTKKEQSVTHPILLWRCRAAQKPDRKETIFER